MPTSAARSSASGVPSAAATRPSTSVVTKSRSSAAPASSVSALRRMAWIRARGTGWAQTPRKKRTIRSPRPSIPGSSSAGTTAAGSNGSSIAAPNRSVLVPK